jgi:glycosyltransferase involved in cell wall biosynthesis
MTNNLVSIIISTYNSSSFVIETLDSVFKQTWKELELIITDDCSEDDTVEVCRNWLINNSYRFVRSEILTFNYNTGVSANGNRGLYASKGDWIKFLGADDTLKPECISSNLEWIQNHPEIKVLFSRVSIYRNTFTAENLIETTPAIPYNPKGILSSGISAGSQYKMLLISDRIHFTPSVFLNRSTLVSVGGFDENFRLLEDYPLWLNLTKNGHILYFMDKVTVNYRRHLKAINNTGIPYLINPNYFKSENFRRIYTYPFLPLDIKLEQRFIWFTSQIFRFTWLNRNIKINRVLLNVFTIYLNPFRQFVRIRKCLYKKLKDNEFYI